MTNKILLFFICILCGTLINVYPQDKIEGIYSIKDDDFKEIIILYPEGNFWYCNDCSSKNTTKDSQGYWYVNDSNLILNSIYPERIIVFEDCSDKKSKYLMIHVLSDIFPNEPHFIYNLHVVNKNNDTLSFYRQIDKTIIKKGISKFWIENVKTGLKSNVYEIQSANSNIFNIIFNAGKIFENESWPIWEDTLNPRNS